MIDQLPAILVLAPLFGAMLVALIGPRNHHVCAPIAVFALTVTLAAAVALALKVFSEGAIDYFMGGWDSPIGIGVHLRIDYLNAPVLVVIGIVFLLVSCFSIRRVGQRSTEKTPYFYTLFLMLCVGLFGITIAGDAFNLFVLIEVTSLSSYGLVAMGNSRRGTHAAFNYLIMGTVGASFYLIGIGYLYMKTGTLNMQEIHTILRLHEDIATSNAIRISFIFLMVGTWIKMAFFPLSGWLPNAYSYAPSTTAAVLAPLMTKISVYVMIRIMTSIYGLELVFSGLGWSNIVVWLAVIAILAGSILALAQREIKKMLCYLIIAEVGYMVGGAWIADPNLWGLTGAIYHILSDAAMTLCLFLAAGVLVNRFEAKQLSDLSGMFSKAPWTFACFTVGALGMIGIPPTCGFFSKFYLIRGGIESGHWEYVIALLISSLVNVVLFFRIFEIAHFGKRPKPGLPFHPKQEPGIATPWNAFVPLAVTASFVILIGVFNGQLVTLIRSALNELTSFAAL